MSPVYLKSLTINSNALSSLQPSATTKLKTLLEELLAYFAGKEQFGWLSKEEETYLDKIIEVIEMLRFL